MFLANRYNKSYRIRIEQTAEQIYGKDVVGGVEERGISQAVIGRLPRYYRYLGDLKSEGVERISSQELSRIMNVTASQIRRISIISEASGQQGYGYNTKFSV